MAYRAALQRRSVSEVAIKLHVVLNAAGKPAEADRVAADWVGQHPKDAAFRFYLGDVATRKRDFAAAETHYRAVLSMQASNALAMNNIAWLMHKQAKPGALEMAEKANALLPNRAPILDTMASIQATSGKLPDAVTTQRKAVASAPNDPKLKLSLARYLIQAGKKSEARDELDALARLGDKFEPQSEVATLMKTL